MESWVPPLCCCTGKAEARSLMDSAQLLDRLCRPQGLTTSSTLCPFISPQWSWMRAETHVSTWAYWDTVGGRKRYAGWAPLGLDDARGGGSTCWTLLFFLPHPSILVRESEHHLLLPGVGWKISCLSVLLLPPSREIKVPPPASAEQETGYRPSLVDTAERESWVAASCFCMMEVRQGGRLAPSLTCWNHRGRGLLQWQPTIKYLLTVVWEYQR